MPADSGEWKRDGEGRERDQSDKIRRERVGLGPSGSGSDSIKGDRGPVVQCSAGPGPNSNLGISYDDEREVHADTLCTVEQQQMTGITIQ